MSENPYAPPKSAVKDMVPPQPARWGRAAWIHLSVFFGLALIVYAEREILAQGLTAASVVAGTILSAGLLNFPVRSLNALSDTAPPWWWDVLYYATVLLFVFGLVMRDLTLVVAGGMPTVAINGLVGLMALVLEKRRNVRVYLSGRRYLFSANRVL